MFGKIESSMIVTGNDREAAKKSGGVLPISCFLSVLTQGHTLESLKEFLKLLILVAHSGEFN